MLHEGSRWASLQPGRPVLHSSDTCSRSTFVCWAPAQTRGSQLSASLIRSQSHSGWGHRCAARKLHEQINQIMLGVLWGKWNGVWASVTVRSGVLGVTPQIELLGKVPKRVICYPTSEKQTEGSSYAKIPYHIPNAYMCSAWGLPFRHLNQNPHYFSLTGSHKSDLLSVS